jgi:hypothetical protein
LKPAPKDEFPNSAFPLEGALDCELKLENEAPAAEFPPNPVVLSTGLILNGLFPAGCINVEFDPSILFGCPPPKAALDCCCAPPNSGVPPPPNSGVPVVPNADCC